MNRNDSLQIRRALADDVETIARFNQAMARETEGRSLDWETLRSGVRRLFESDALGVYYLARRGGTVVGQMLITYEWSDWRNGLFWWIQSVYVSPEARGAGVYRSLHSHVESLARSTLGVCGLRLYVEAENTGAQQVYERVGMHRTSYQFFEVDWSGTAPS